jgi:hypothetical protein
MSSTPEIVERYCAECKTIMVRDGARWLCVSCGGHKAVIGEPKIDIVDRLKTSPVRNIIETARAAATEIPTLRSQVAALTAERDEHNAARKRQIITQQQWWDDLNADLTTMLAHHGITTFGVDNRPIPQMFREHPTEQVLSSVIASLTAQRDAMVEALNSIAYDGDGREERLWDKFNRIINKARSALALIKQP